MQAYAEGFELMHKCAVRRRPRGGRRPLEPRLGGPLVAVRAGRARVRGGGQRPRGAQGLRERLRRGPLDGHRRDRPRRPDAGDHRLAVRALLLARQGRLHAQGAGRAAQPVRRPRRGSARDDGVAENPLVEGLERLPVPATTLVIFGATGDLARRKLLPALYNLAHEGALPERFNLIGVSRRDLSDDDFRDQAREAIERVLAPHAGRRRCSTGCSAASATLGSPFDDAAATQPRRGAGRARRRGRAAAQPRLLPLDGARVLPGDHRGDQGERPAPAEHAEVRVVIEKPFGTDLASARSLRTPCTRCSASARSSASTTTSARRRSRT